VKPFCQVNYVRYGGGLFFNGCLLIVVGYQINVVAYGRSGAPEEEPVNPPSDSVSVLFFA